MKTHTHTHKSGAATVAAECLGNITGVHVGSCSRSLLVLKLTKFHPANTTAIERTTKSMQQHTAHGIITYFLSFDLEAAQLLLGLRAFFVDCGSRIILLIATNLSVHLLGHALGWFPLISTMFSHLFRRKYRNTSPALWLACNILQVDKE